MDRAASLKADIDALASAAALLVELGRSTEKARHRLYMQVLAVIDEAYPPGPSTEQPIGYTLTADDEEPDQFGLTPTQHETLRRQMYPSHAQPDADEGLSAAPKKDSPFSLSDTFGGPGWKRSFFRHLAENHGALHLDYEVVLRPAEPTKEGSDPL